MKEGGEGGKGAIAGRREVEGEGVGGRELGRILDRAGTQRGGDGEIGERRARGMIIVKMEIGSSIGGA
ncbi:uncharacterized protein J3R85_016184 [Psidium guajava]|nr:uncharacterized protein J3R85_016184 [Psidium guajava]